MTTKLVDRRMDQLRLQAAALDAADNAIMIADVKGTILRINPAFTRLTGYSTLEAEGRNARILKSGRHDRAFYEAIWKTICSGEVWSGEMINRRKDGSLYYEDQTITPVRAKHSEISHFIAIKQDITRRKLAEEKLHEQTRLAHLGADVGAALTQADTLPQMLKHCCQSLIRHLDAAVARIWTVYGTGDVLELQASAGLHTHLDGPHSRVAVGQLRIGQIAQERKSHLTNDVLNDSQVSENEWARREEIVAFSGCPLVIDNRLVGVVAIYSRHLITEDTHQAMESLATQIASDIERKRAEAERDGLLLRLQMQIDRMPLGYLLLDGDCRIIDWNSTAKRIFGYSKEEMLGVGPPFEKIIPATARQEAESILVRLRSGDMAANAINENLTKDGRTIICEWSNTPLLDADGTFVGVLSLVHDVTERTRSERTLREREERIHLLLDSTAEGIYGIDLHGRCMFANMASARILGFPSPDALIGKNMHELVHHTHSDGTPYPVSECRIFHAFKKSEGTHVDNEVLWRADGTSFAAEYWSYPIRQDADVVGAVVAFLDITERRKLEQEFRGAQERLQHVVSSSPAVLYALEGSGKELGPTWISENVFDMLGYTVNDVFAPKWWHERIHPEDLNRALDEIEDSLFGQGHVSQEYRFRHRNGSYRWIRSEMRLLREVAGTSAQIVGSWSDITERKQLEDQFRQAQKMEAVGRLAGGVAHDFNNLLTIISGYSEVILATVRQGDPLKDLAEQIKKAGERAAGLTRQLLAFSRKQVLVPVSLNVNELLAEIGKMLGRLIGEDIDLKITIGTGVWRTKADPGQIEQVVVNLVVNARDAMPEGGKLTIETKNVKLDDAYVAAHSEARTGRFVLLAVSDTGCGMDQGTKQRIFEPFFSTKGEKGTGLGLATVYGIVKQSGGHIEVYSELGHGTTFKVNLPEDREGAHTSKSYPGLEISPRGTETILIAEDEDGVRGLTRMVLQQSGYRVLEAKNGGEALLVCEQFQGKIHLLVTDVVMPKMSGRQLAERLTKLRPELKVLYVSGYTDDAIVHHGVLDPGTAFLGKPFSPNVLARKVREVLDQSTMGMQVACPSFESGVLPAREM